MDDQNKLNDITVLVLKVGEEEYGIHIKQIVSIERMQGLNITAYPNRQPHVLGFSSIRNVVVPIVDFRSALNGDSLNELDGTRMIIVQVLDKEIGIVVDSATDVIDVTSETIQYPNLLETREVSYFKGVSKIDDRFIILLDIEKLLENTTNLDELKSLIDSYVDSEGSSES
jgi:purine-binding chemotaxis protein CheW